MTRHFTTNSGHSGPEPLPLGTNGEIEVTLALGQQYETTDKPSIIFSVHRTSKEKYSRLPIINPKSKQTAENLVSKIAQSF